MLPLLLHPWGGVGTALGTGMGTGMGSGDGPGHGTMVARPWQHQERTALGGTGPCPKWGLGLLRGLGGVWAAVEASGEILGKVSLQDINVTSVSPQALFLGGICHC